MAQNIPRGTPARVLVLLALLVGLVAVSAWRDALRRDTTTWVRHPTALGDTGLFLPGQPPVRLTTDGKSIVLSAGAATLNRRDDRMFRVSTGFGENLPFSVFTTTEILESEAEPRLYARIAPHQFLRLRATLTDPGPLPGGDPDPTSAPARPATEPRVLKAIPVPSETGESPVESPENGTL